VGSSIQKDADVYLPVNKQAITRCLQFHFVVPLSKVFQDHMQASFVAILHDDSVPKDV
jgi:hypothetical protein